MQGEDDTPPSYSSPPCFMHELEAGFRPGAEPADPVQWADVARWRKAERARLLAARLEMSADERRGKADAVAAALDEAIGELAGRTVGIYFPIRGEMDLRPWMASLVARGGGVALPVVVEKGRPLAFHAYSPGDRLIKGFWNIPVPESARPAAPDILIAPLVGFAGTYRLGYGGGYFDRTLASLPGKPLVIGVGYETARLPTIYPQPHDIPMDRIVTA